VIRNSKLLVHSPPVQETLVGTTVLVAVIEAGLVLIIPLSIVVP
jgi:hypothetical protein